MIAKHLQTALAASVDLRCYGLTSPRHDGIVSVHFGDLNNFFHEWKIDCLPWHAVQSVPLNGDLPDAIDDHLAQLITSTLSGLTLELHPKAKSAAVAFLYLYMTLAHTIER